MARSNCQSGILAHASQVNVPNTTGAPAEVFGEEIAPPDWRSACVTDGAISVEWRDDGFFRAPRNTHLAVNGVASDSEVIAELLKRSGIVRTSRSVYRARPNGEVDDFGWTGDAAHDAGYLDAELDYQLGAGRPPGFESQLATISAELPRTRGALEDLARARAAALNRDTPQVGEHRVFIPPFDEHDHGAHGVRGSACRGWASWTDWVAPELIVNTSSKAWNTIDRHPPRGTVVNVAAWLHDATASAGAFDQWIRKMFGQDPMLLRLVDGPAGPVYEVVSGTHRAHAARIWGLPVVLARVQVDRLPTPIGPGPSGDLSRLWLGLRRRGLLQADVVGDQWFLRWVAAEWMLTSPLLATRMNGVYERLYPGALQRLTGMTMRELLEPKRWARALSE